MGPVGEANPSCSIARIKKTNSSLRKYKHKRTEMTRRDGELNGGLDNT